jgi:hypothetical protein
MRFQSKFVSSTDTDWTCAASEQVMPNVNIEFTADGHAVGDMPMDFVIPDGSNAVNAAAFVGSIPYSYSVMVGTPASMDEEHLLLLSPAPANTAYGKAIRGSSGRVKIGRTVGAGNHVKVRMIESFLRQGGTVFRKVTGLDALSSVECTDSTSFSTVLDLQPAARVWLADPWGPCSTTPNTIASSVSFNQSLSIAAPTTIPDGCQGTRSRNVQCVISSGQPATGCDPLSQPADNQTCFAPQCSGNLRLNGTTGESATIDQALAGEWTVLYQVYTVTLNGTEAVIPASRLALRLATLVVGPDASVAEPTLATHPGPFMKWNSPGEVYNGTASTPTTWGEAAATESFVARVHSASGGVLQGNTAATAASELLGSGSPVAFSYAWSTVPGGVFSSMQAGSRKLGIVRTPALPLLAGGLRVAGQESRSLVSPPGTIFPPLSDVQVGIAVAGPTVYRQEDHGACQYRPAENNCTRVRPADRCENGLGETVDSRFCLDQPVLPRIGADSLPCSGCIDWSVGNWTGCSEICGTGVRTRTVQCLDSAGAVLPDSYCAAYVGPKPDTSGSCNEFACADYRTDAWSACSTSCGAGTRSRVVECVDVFGPLPESRCVSEGRQRPISSEACFLCPCENEALAVEPVKSFAGQWHGSRSVRMGYNITTSRSFCSPGSQLLKRSEFLCYQSTKRTTLCNSLLQVMGDEIIPIAFRAESDETLAAPRFVPDSDPRGTNAPDIRLLKGDSGCTFPQFAFADAVFTDPSRQSAIGLCRALA